MYPAPATGQRTRRSPRSLRALIRSNSGVALIEFALVMPVLTVLAMYGVELAYMASVNMQLSQIALSLADNASRMEQTNNSAVLPTVTEADISSILVGATRQGQSFGLSGNGRVIVSSLEREAATQKQYIHWQRCSGALKLPSAYGDDGAHNGLTGTPLTGMGRGNSRVTATTNGIAVMFVEVYYRYNGLFGTLFVRQPLLKQEAAYLVRDVRDTSSVSPSGTKATCT